MTQRDTRAFLITNPKSGRGGVDLSAAMRTLRAHGWEVTVRQKLHGGAATELARDAVCAGYNVIVDCGGDGTLNEIVEGVVGTGAAVGAIPGGTANLWAHEVGISRSPEMAALQLVGATQRRVDVGQVAVNGQHKRHFLLMAGLGLDAAVLNQLSKPLKNRVGWLAYAPATLRALRSFRAAPVDVDMDGVQWRGHTLQIVVGNTRRFGGFTRMCPHAYIDDGLLDVCLVQPSNPLVTSRQVSTMLLRQHPSPASALEYRAAAITIRTSVVLPLEVDGGSVQLDDDDLTPQGAVYTFSLVAQGVSVLVPRTYDGEMFEPRRFADELADIPVRPVVAPTDRGSDDRDEHNGHNGHDARTGEKTKSWKVKVLAVGADSLSVARVKNGRVVQVVVAADTVLEDAAGEERPLWGALSTLTKGDLLRVKGVNDAEQGVLRAERVALDDREPGHATH